MNKLVSIDFYRLDFDRRISFLEEATFDWPAYLLGNVSEQPIVSFESDDEEDEEDRNESTFIATNKNEETEIELKSIDDIEQEN
jgi:hypothetical protein